jgi:hypothetical protein
MEDESIAANLEFNKSDNEIDKNDKPNKTSKDIFLLMLMKIYKIKIIYFIYLFIYLNKLFALRVE